jgi:CRP-like cAMP-binding protein
LRAETDQPPAEQETSVGNRLLTALPGDEYEQLRPHLALVMLELKQEIWTPNQPIEAVYFPIDLVASILAETESGSIEVGTIGNEGVVGLPVYLGAISHTGTAMAQIPGRAYRVDVTSFRRQSQNGRLRELLQRYTLAFMTQVSQGTACNRSHSAEQRLARWLLLVQDRVGRDEFPLTQEFMGQMLGVRRATVSETASELQSSGLIKYRRGAIRIEDRAGLERVSCECYRIVRNDFERLLGVPMG